MEIRVTKWQREELAHKLQVYLEEPELWDQDGDEAEITDLEDRVTKHHRNSRAVVIPLTRRQAEIALEEMLDVLGRAEGDGTGTDLHPLSQRLSLRNLVSQLEACLSE